jgi:lipopolysaccharide export system ATP-binding protein
MPHLTLSAISHRRTAHHTAHHTATQAALEARSLRWHRAGRWIVDGVDLTVTPGEIVGLLGPNGAGKTVTLSMLVGMIEPTSGRVLIDGVDVTDLPLYKRARLGLGYLPQDRSIFTKLSAEDNVAAILEAHGMSGGPAHRRADELLGEFGLSHVANTRAEQLSGGEQRRLEVARSLAIEPRFLLFDEPFAGIDPLTIESLHALLVKLRRSGVGILLTDHNVRETLTLCDRAYVLFAGRVLAQGSPAELIVNEEVRQHFLGDSFELMDDATTARRDPPHVHV